MKKSVTSGRPAKYTKDMILGLVKTAKASGKSVKQVIASIAVRERSRLTPTQRKKKFHPSVSYVPVLVAASRVGLSLRALMKGTRK